MGPIDTGPPGCWLAGAIMALVGVAAVIYFAAKGIIWLLNHVHIS